MAKAVSTFTIKYEDGTTETATIEIPMEQVQGLKDILTSSTLQLMAGNDENGNWQSPKLRFVDTRVTEISFDETKGFYPDWNICLDKRNYPKDLEEAQMRASDARTLGSTNKTIYYFGMPMYVKNEKGLYEAYIIQPIDSANESLGGELKPLVVQSSGGISADDLGDSLEIDPTTGKLNVKIAQDIDDTNINEETEQKYVTSVKAVRAKVGDIDTKLATI